MKMNAPVPGQETDAAATKGQQEAKAEKVAITELYAGVAARLASPWIEVENVVDAERQSNYECLSNFDAIDSCQNIDTVDTEC